MRKIKNLLFSTLIIFGILFVPTLVNAEDTSTCGTAGAELTDLQITDADGKVQSITFRKDSCSYSVIAEDDVEKVTITATPESGAELDGFTNGEKTLNTTGNTEFNIIVKNSADNTLTTTYRMVVVRRSDAIPSTPSETKLTSLSYNGIQITLEDGKLEYLVNVTKAVKEVTIEAKAASGIEVSPTNSKATLDYGENRFQISLKGTDGKIVNYVLIINRSNSEVVTTIINSLKEELGDSISFYVTDDENGNEVIDVTYSEELEDGTIATLKFTVTATTEDDEESLANKILEKVENPDKIYMTQPENGVITKDTLEIIKETGKEVEFYVPNANLTWTINGSQITDEDKEINLNVTVGEEVNEETRGKIEKLLVNKENGLVIDFAHSGNLPKGTKVKVYVGEKFKAGDTLTLFYFDSEANTLKETVKNIKVDEDGYVTFTLEHCSSYVLTGSTNNAGTGAMNIAFYIVLAVVSLGGIVFLLKMKSN